MPGAPVLRTNRWAAYAAFSLALASGVVVKALAQRPNFYSAAVYLAQSSANVMILANLVFVTAATFLLLLQKLLYGPLRPIEIESLYEKAWFAVTETCLAMTIFRGEIGAWFLVMFFSLLAGKVWGWIGEGRVEVLEQQPPRNPRLFHTRLALSLGLSVVFDLTMLEYVIKQVMHMAKPDMMVMFGFEFAVLSILSLNTAVRYAINLVEIGIVRGQKTKRIEEIRKERVDAAVRSVQEAQQEATRTATGDTAAGGDDGVGTQTSSGADLARESARAAAEAAQQPIDEAEIEVEGWEGKGRWMFYLDLMTDFWKLVLYLSFFIILLVFYGLPLHIMRDVFLTCRSFFKRIGDFMRYRTATRDMNERYPDATAEDIGREDVCIICREEMRPYQPAADGAQPNPVAERMRPKKLPCGHVLHFACLRSWLERQQICPTCRANVVPAGQARSGVAAAGVPGAAAAPGAHRNGPAGGGAAAAAAAGPRVYQLGPLRIGVGAARGNNMFEELEQRLANADQEQNQPANPNAPQQYGFGIRWDGVRRRAQPRHSRGTVQEQLESAERQIQRELDSLQSSMGELQALRNVQAQLARIRLMRDATAAAAAGDGGQQARGPAEAIARLPQPSMTPLVASSQQNILQAGSDQLPPGLTLPEGWSMMPLQPLQGFGSGQAPSAQPSPAQTNSTAAGQPQGQQQPQSSSPEAQSSEPTQTAPADHHLANGVTPVQSQPSSTSSGLPTTLVPHQVPTNHQSSVLDQTQHESNGRRPAEEDASSQRAINGTREAERHQPPTVPITLPSWGSAAEPVSRMNGTTTDRNGSGRDSNSSTETQQKPQPDYENGQQSASSGSTKRNATVEDLVEDPD